MCSSGSFDANATATQASSQLDATPNTSESIIGTPALTSNTTVQLTMILSCEGGEEASPALFERCVQKRKAQMQKCKNAKLMQSITTITTATITR